jgi:hypothetical protein
MFEYFYHEIFRRTIIAFGSLFDNIEISHADSSDSVKSIIKVPLAYGPMQKFLARLEQSPDLDRSVQITLPRMSFEFVGLTYDASRKVTTTQSFVTSSNSGARKVYMPVPYNMAFELSIYTKLNDDMLQIIEQILPYFQPSYNLTVNLVETIGEKRDVPIVLENITMQDDYEGDFNTRRSLTYILRFTAKTYLFGPIPSSTETSKDIIKKVSIGYVSDTTKNPSRELTYSVEPRAIKSYTNNIVTNLSQDIGEESTLISVNDSSNIPENSYITIDNESMYVDKKSGNQLTVMRGTDKTIKQSHVSGSQVKLITASDNNLIPIGDDFGFNESL